MIPDQYLIQQRKKLLDQVLKDFLYKAFTESYKKLKDFDKEHPEVVEYFRAKEPKGAK